LHWQAFIVTQRHGAWGKAIAVPGLARLNKFMAGLTGVSCPSAGNCGATGSYQTRSRRTAVFLVSEVHGVWGHPVTPPGITALPDEVLAKGQAFGLGIGPISCPTPGNCGAIGTYPIKLRFGNLGGFVISQVHGIWRHAIALPGLSALNQGHDAALDSISCPTPGNCGAAGTYAVADGTFELFVVNEVNGTWNKAIEVPGLARLDKADESAVFSLSCSSAGNCGAAGFYASALIKGRPIQQAFVVNQVHGVWAEPIEVQGTGTLNTAGNAAVLAISCPATNRCSAGGFYQSKKSGVRTFAVSQP
jgi:hypothetical protein